RRSSILDPRPSSRSSVLRGLYQSLLFRSRRRIPLRSARRKMKVPLMALCVWLSVATQSESFEKRAMSAAQQISASSLDAKLPNRSFVAWLNDLVGRDAGVVWQLAECGSGAPGGTGQDAQACAEANVLLSNGDTVTVGISVGTFKQGL